MDKERIGAFFELRIVLFLRAIDLELQFFFM